MDDINTKSDTCEDITWHFMKLFSEKRKEMNLSVRDLGTKANVSYTVIYDFEQRGVLPKMETLIKIAYALGFYVDIKQLETGLIISFSIDKSVLNLASEIKIKQQNWTVDEQLDKILNQKGLHTKEIEEIKSFIAFKLSQHKQ